ncbi:P-loop containing nucleoside triphosphate hydrolase protein [Tribonema minus]|uniref:P-loop containing nucleoside triphosphate hydrolase protein n=1 Tax=Tribonema minus TaxID=303371 RepID=A0A835YUJ8_9STRA|nr:P-loop containing nucleoside triphosphate hydrolase protein [Tribonema minus]
MSSFHLSLVLQCLVVLACFAGSVTLLLDESGAGNITPSQLGSWDLGWQLVILALELWGLAKPVPVHAYSHMNEEYAAGMFSYFHFNWYTRVINTGYKRPLQPEDLPQLIDHDRASFTWSIISRLLYPNGPNNVIDGSDLRVGLCVLKMGGGRIWLQAVWAFLSSLTQIAPALAMFEITDFMANYKPGAGQDLSRVVLLCIGGLFMSQAVATYADGMMFKLGRRLGIRAKAALVSAVFRKSLALDMGSVDVGKLQNHISVDAESVLNLCVFQMFMWGAVLRLLACVVLLFYYLGLSAFGGIGLLVLTLPVNNYIIGRLKRYQQTLMKRRDKRMGVVNEAMQGIRIIKLFAWEDNFLKRVFAARGHEIALLRAYMFTLGCFMVTVKASPTIVGLVTFLVHTQAFGYKLSAATGFTALALFNQLRMPLAALPSTINEYIQARISFRRLNSLLSSTSSDVHSKDGQQGDRNSALLQRGQIRVENGTFRWRASNPLDPPTLRDISLEVLPGEFVCVYGPTGSGKSTLLMAVLQELITEKGKALMNGSVAYASQKAWIQNATVRDNILFGRPFDPVRYEQVLEACALKSDLTILEVSNFNDIASVSLLLRNLKQAKTLELMAAFTVIVLCSLARAVYNDADIVLLDDVLSAVDAHVGKHIFERCITGVLKGKTVLLVTHQVNMTAPKADRIIVFNTDGTIRETGTYAELTKDGTGHLNESKAAGAGENGGKPAEAKRGLIIAKEAHAQGNPKLSLYMRYFKYCGGSWFGAAWLGLSLLWQALTVAQSFYLKEWINEMAADNDNGPGLWRYIAVSVGSFFALLARTIIITGGSVQASKRVHHAMATSVFGAPISWFDATPLGRIFNRFSSDIVTLDKDLMNDISTYGDMLLGVVGVVAVIAVAIPVLTVAMLPVLLLCYWYGERYLQTSRQLKRLEAVNRSPLYAHFSESINGASTIRAFSQEQRFIETNCAHVDKLNRCHLYLWCANYWLTNRVRLIGSAVCGLVGVFLVADVSNIDGSTGGLVLTYVLQFTVSIVFTVRLHAQMEMSVNSIERLDEYCNLKQEAPAIIPDNRPPDGWPQHGSIDIRNLTLKYASSTAPVLHNLTFHVPERTRVGIVGRTGAGKSSLTNALFRMVEPQAGSIITIDGVDIMKIGLKDLRRNLAIIPQEPTLFQGTIRSNIDPFNEYADTQIWEALGQCHLDDYVRSTEKQLSHEISDAGSNLSVGQRQLMCMARALLRRAAVLILDEATANIDRETDTIIQETMKEGFQDCTILCIAHRLHTVVYYDKILVLEAGRVAEYDTPRHLLKDKSSRFYGLCRQSGDLRTLIRMAEEGQEAVVAAAHGSLAG